jgi:hypothetical protein
VDGTVKAKRWQSNIPPTIAGDGEVKGNYLRVHILPVFASSVTDALVALDVPGLQQFATSLEKTLSSETFINILETVFAALRYAIKPGMRTTSVTFSDLTVKAPDARLPEGGRRTLRRMLFSPNTQIRTLNLGHTRFVRRTDTASQKQT